MRVEAADPREHLSPAQMCVMGMIAAHSTEGGGAILSKRQMSMLSGYSDDAIKLAVRELKRKGYLTVESRFAEDGSRLSNRYRIVAPG
ncbi:helix-turn-helix domain-containing protein [Eggerthella guodeyinii]|uniref:Helix-turn-helix domain-containing protein n=1 Tax=Eggerthella guodeyinii TaxID=2690837 RepID=A0A6N7RJY2_9ACTN|nr:helix-turn-helix domain-containing protein [Eggerthella guodeyinii]MRX81247.1 hypothetical protein [Eggerthella guodeyinii]